MEDSHDDRRGDSKYRRYVAAVDKCLQSFESVNEWADVISFLSRLAKVFQSFQHFNTVPFKLNLAKRLAQCLNPALPTGVHQKTLEVYEMVFRKIGNDGLAKDLSVYSFGLFPFFEHSATLVRNLLLELYAVYLVPLGVELRPSLRPLVLSIILGLEEESSECFVKVNSLLNDIKVAAGTAEFYEALWTGLLISPHHRQAIVNFLLKNIPSGSTAQELTEICFDNTKLVSRALAAALQDAQQLVVRGSLDILLKHFAIDKRFFETSELVDLAQAAMVVLMRKDMSLTRRFYSWIITSHGSTEQESLSEHALQVLIVALRNLINVKTCTTDDMSRPFKLLVFILDKPLVSDPLVKECLFDLVYILIRSSDELPAENYQKVLASANLLFRMLELDIIWSKLCREILDVESGDAVQTARMLKAVSYAVMNLSVCDDSSPMIHLHLAVFVTLKTHFSATLPPSVTGVALDLCLCLMAKLAASTLEPASVGISAEAAMVESERLLQLLLGGAGPATELDQQHVSAVMLANLNVLLRSARAMFVFAHADMTRPQHELFEQAARIMSLFLGRLNLSQETLKQTGFFDWLEHLITTLKTSNDMEVTRILLEQVGELSAYWMSSGDSIRLALIGEILPMLWSRLLVHTQDQLLMTTLIAKVCRIHPVDADIYFAKVLSAAIRGGRFSEIDRFARFWEQAVSLSIMPSVPLRTSVLVLTDAMTKEEFKFRKCATAWVFHLSQHLELFLVPAMTSVLDMLESSMPDGALPDASSSRFNYVFRKTFDAGPIVYYMTVLRRLLQVNHGAIMNFLSTAKVDGAPLGRWNKLNTTLRQLFNVSIDANAKKDYFNFILTICLPLLVIDEHKLEGSTQSSVKTAVLDLLSMVVGGADADCVPVMNVFIKLSVDKLGTFVSLSNDGEKQQQFLGLFGRLFANPLTAALFDIEDVLLLGEMSRRALKTTTDAEAMDSWTNFVTTLALLPSSDIELTLAVLNDSLTLRLESLDDQFQLSEGLLASTFSCITKLVVFYFVVKSNVAAGSPKDQTQLRTSVSGLLNETISEAVSHVADARSVSAGSIEALQRAIFGLLHAHTWITDHHILDIRDGIVSWSQCLAVLARCCHKLYQTNQPIVTQVLIAVFLGRSPNRKCPFFPFLSMFFERDGAEFLRAVWLAFRSGKDSSLRHQDTILRILTEFSASDCDDMLNLELWSMIMILVKESLSSSPKYKAVAWCLLENCCRVLSRLNRIDFNRQSKDLELVQRFCENCVALSAKLNDSAQWTKRVDEEIAVDSELFTVTLLESVKDKALARCMNSVCRVLIPSLTGCFNDIERISSIMTSIITNIVTPNFKSPLRSSLLGQISAYCLREALSLNMSSLKPWRRELWEAFFDGSFLWMPPYYFRVMSEAFRLITADPDRFNEVLNKMTMSTTAVMFLSKDAEILSKAQMIRRLSLLTFWANFDAFRMHLPALQEKLVELTKYYNGLVLGETFFLIRVMLLRLSDESISSLWPLIMTELVQVFESAIRAESISSSDLYALFQACKLIDMMLTLRTSSILMYHWLFFDSVGNVGLFMRLQQKLQSGQLDSDGSKNPSTSNSRRPLLSSSCVKDPSELVSFLRDAKSHMSHDFIMIQEVDMDFINCMSERDLLEPLELK